MAKSNYIGGVNSVMGMVNDVQGVKAEVKNFFKANFMES